MPSIDGGSTVIFLQVLPVSLNINEMPPIRTSFICGVGSLFNRKKKVISVIVKEDYYFQALQYLLFDMLV